MDLNLHEALKDFPALSRQLPCKDLMFTQHECQQTTRAQQLYQSNLIVYVLSGKRIFIKNEKLGDIRDGACAFVRKGTHVFYEMEEGVGWCVKTFFIPDDFFKQLIRDNLKNLSLTNLSEAWADHVILLEVNDLCKSFFFPCFRILRKHLRRQKSSVK